MNWMVASGWMFVSSVVLYVSLRLCSKMGIPTSLNNLASFLVPVLLYVPFAFATSVDFSYRLQDLAVLLTLFAAFGYVGNRLILASIAIAPNPGYSLVIAKSYVTFTTVVSVLWLHGTLDAWGVLAIVAIVAGSGMVMIDPRAEKRSVSSKTWAWMAIGAYLCWGLLSLTARHLADSGIGPVEQLIPSFCVISALCALDVVRSREVALRVLDGRSLLLLVGMGIASASFNYFSWEAVRTAPNVGYVNAINAGSIAAVTVVSSLVFGDDLSRRKLAAVGIVTSGLAVLVLTK